jgi:signal transduction histidine kinase
MTDIKPADQTPEEEDQSLDSLADQYSELSDANRRLRRKIFDLYTVFEISRHLSSMLDTETLIDAILLTCLGQMGVEGAVIFTTDNSGGLLVRPYAKGFDSASLKDVKIKLDSPLIELLLKGGKPLTSLQLTNMLGDEKEHTDALKFIDFRLAAPMIMKNRLLGVLFLPGKISGAEFYESDIEFLSLLMNQLAVALENANLYEQERETNEELQRTQRLLIMSEKMAALGKLSASIAHEVNNPLGIISNYLHILSVRKLPEDVYANYIKILKEEVKRIAGIVRQLLDFYRPQQEEISDVDIKRVVAETLALLSNQLAAANIDVKLRIDNNLPIIQGSPEKLKQVFLNLIMNSRDFMPTGGEISIRAKSSGLFAEIELSDNGPGISNEHISRIFEPFFTTKGDDGTGLGLAVCYGIIQWHQGTITVHNNDRGGATFTIMLPVYRDYEK